MLRRKIQRSKIDSYTFLVVRNTLITKIENKWTIGMRLGFGDDNTLPRCCLEQVSKRYYFRAIFVLHPFSRRSEEVIFR